jgi:hypothetical protein
MITESRGAACHRRPGLRYVVSRIRDLLDEGWPPAGIVGVLLGAHFLISNFTPDWD